MVLTSLAGERNLPRWFEPFFSTIQRFDHCSIEIGLPDGRVFGAASGRDGPSGRINIRNQDFFARMVRVGEIALPEMYMDGWWETPDLQALLDVIVLNNETIEHDFHGAVLARTYERLRHWLRPNTRRGARRNISYHYDLGNDFYSLWLDETMTYSSALFSGQGETLSQAQKNKYAAICDLIGLRPGDHVLEIGCGWGGFAEYAIAERKARVTGLTLSREQQEFARKRLFEAGFAERSEILLRDYRDERGQYDAIASIEMFEAVGEKYWPAYFASLRDRLTPGRVAALQVITIDERWFDLYRRRADFIQKYIFPGGMLPSPSALSRQTAAAGLEIVGSTEFGDSYSRTLREWREAFNARWPDIAAELRRSLQPDVELLPCLVCSLLQCRYDRRYATVPSPNLVNRALGLRCGALAPNKGDPPMNRTRRQEVAGLAGFVLLCLAVSAFGGLATSSSVGTWYQTLAKPSFNPPDWVFAPVWTTLYIFMAITGWRVWRTPDSRVRTLALRAFYVQLALNLLWSFLFFGMQAIDLALVEIIVLLAAIVATMVLFWRIDRPAGMLFLPYSMWVAFASLLNSALWLLN